jgi:[ribosomal protein S5]-alanine N-acetyltransferase
MLFIETPRLYLVPTPLTIVQKRLESDNFSAEIALPTTQISVTFPPEWPGDAIVFFPDMAQKSESDFPNAWDRLGLMMTKTNPMAIGGIGCKGPLSEDGTLDIGYGTNPSVWGQGYMTEAVIAFSNWLLAQDGVRRVTADCLSDNIGSVRVLEKSGFSKIGEHYDEEEGGHSLSVGEAIKILVAKGATRNTD